MASETSPQHMYSWRMNGAFSESAVFVQTKAGVLKAVKCPDHWMHLHLSRRTCPHMSLWTSLWTPFAGVPHSISLWHGFFRTLLPIQTLRMPTKYPSVGLTELCQMTTATQVLVNPHWEVLLNLAVGVFPQLKLAGLCAFCMRKGGVKK